MSEATATLLDTYVELNRRKRELEAEVNLLKKQIAPIEAELLDEYAAEGVRSKGTQDGATVYLTRKIWARATDLGKPAACAALKRAGLGDYVEEGFNTNSLSAYFRERAKELEEQTGAPVAIDDVLPSELRDVIALTEDHKLNIRL